MKSLRIIAAALVLAPLVALSVVGNAVAAATSPVTLTLTRVGNHSFPPSSVGIDTRTQADEIDAAMNGDTDSGSGTNDEAGVNRTLPGAKTGKGKPISPNKKSKSNPTLNVSVEGLNFNNQRFANSGNQFSVEPPDQGLCVGNGFVARVRQRRTARVSHRRHSGDGCRRPQHFLRLSAGDRPHRSECRSAWPVHHRPGLHLRPGDRALRARGADARPRRPHGSLNGNNHLDIAVSDTGDPTGAWTIYQPAGAEQRHRRARPITNAAPDSASATIRTSARMRTESI